MRAAWVTLACGSVLAGGALASALEPGSPAGIAEAVPAPHEPGPSPYDGILEPHRSAEAGAAAPGVPRRGLRGVQPGIFYGGPPPIDTPGPHAGVLLALAGAALGLARRRRP